jgi:hypothetical protein
VGHEADRQAPHAAAARGNRTGVHARGGRGRAAGGVAGPREALARWAEGGGVRGSRGEGKERLGCAGERRAGHG